MKNKKKILPRKSKITLNMKKKFVIKITLILKWGE